MGLHPVMPMEQGAAIVKEVTDNKEEQEQEQDMELELEEGLEAGLEEATLVKTVGRATLLEVAEAVVVEEDTVDTVAHPMVEVLALVLELLRTEILLTVQPIVPL